jgi:hypothetical protein
MNKVTTLDLPRRNKTHTYFIAGDWHSFHLNKLCMEALLRHAQHMPKKERKLIINGDFTDQWYFMKKDGQFKKWVKRSDGLDEFFVPMWDEEIDWANNTLDTLQKTFHEIIFIHGNHDKQRSAFFQQVCPAGYKDYFDMDKKLHFASRAIQTVEYNNWLDVGDLSITHGMFHGTSAWKRHFDASGGRNVIFSHVHHDNKLSFMSRGETKQVHSLPAMCDLNPDYIRNSETNWTNGYGKFHVQHTGDTHVQTYRMKSNVILDEFGKPI